MLRYRIHTQQTGNAMKKVLAIIGIWVVAVLVVFGLAAAAQAVYADLNPSPAKVVVHVTEPTVAYNQGDMAQGTLEGRIVYVDGIWRAGQDVPAYPYGTTTATDPVSGKSVAQEFLTVKDYAAVQAEKVHFAVLLVGFFLAIVACVFGTNKILDA